MVKSIIKGEKITIAHIRALLTFHFVYTTIGGIETLQYAGSCSHHPWSKIAHAHMHPIER
jgi:hypothetical protein